MRGLGCGASIHMSPMISGRLPPGTRYVPIFADSAGGSRLLDSIDSAEWRGDLKRRVQHYGWRYDYTARRVTADMRLGRLPDWLAALADSIAAQPEFDRRPDQVIVNEYLPGQGISAHVDCEPCFGPTIASLSLGGAAEMIFRHRSSGERVTQLLEPLSLLILSGESRYDWTHEIPARKSDLVSGVRHPRNRRVSLTFRTVLV